VHKRLCRAVLLRPSTGKLIKPLTAILAQAQHLIGLRRKLIGEVQALAVVSDPAPLNG